MAKKIYLHLLGLIFSLPIVSFAQSNCEYSGNGFPVVDDIPCIIMGQSTDIYIPYRCFDSIVASYTEPAGYVFWSDRMFSLKLESLTGIPCGLSFTIDTSGGAINREQTACLHLQGTATDTAGYYIINAKASFQAVELTTGAYTHQNVSLDKYMPPTRQLVIRLVNPATTCTPVAEEDKIYNNAHCN